MKPASRNQPLPHQFYTPAFNSVKANPSSASAPCGKPVGSRSPFDKLGLSDPSYRLFKTPGNTNELFPVSAKGSFGDPGAYQRVKESKLFKTLLQMKLSDSDGPEENDENRDSTDQVTCIKTIREDEENKPRNLTPQRPQSNVLTPRVFIPCASPVGPRAPPLSSSRPPVASRAPPVSHFAATSRASCPKSPQQQPQPPLPPSRKPVNPVNPPNPPSSHCSSTPAPRPTTNSVDTHLRSADSLKYKQPHSRHDLKTVKVNNKSYYILSTLGHGGSAKVYQIYEPATQKSFACKYVDLKNAEASTREGYENEIDLLIKLRDCDRVVKLYDHERVMSGSTVSRLILIMEKGDADLHQLLKNAAEKDPDSPSGFRFHPSDIKYYWKEMLKAVNEIHQKDVVHADIKPVNFITVAGKLKLIDFGIANAIETDHTSVIKDNQIGTVTFMAPEAFVRPHASYNKPIIKLNCKADIWSLGCILYYLVYGKALFQEYSTMFAKIQAIMNENCIIDFPENPDEDLVDCLKRCLQRDPKARPTAEELLRHPYLTRA